MELKGVYLLTPNIFRDSRGRISKVFHKNSFEELNLECDWGETLITENYKKGIVRGFHFQEPPYAQAKTICCVTGSIRNWVLDLRENSTTYGKTIEVCLDSEKRQILYVPKGMANCYYIKENNTTICYNLTGQYVSRAAKGINWKSVALGLDEEVLCSDKDNDFPDLDSFSSPFVYGENC